MMTEKIRALYVDDESTLLELCKMFLERSGDFTVTIATNAPEAIQILGQERFDAIVSDYQMPEMDGIDFLKQVRATDKSIPFIIFTGKGREEIAVEAFENGADFYIRKGGEPKAQFAELSHKTKKAVEVRRAEEDLRRSNERYQMVFENTGTAMVVIEEDTTISMANTEFAHITGMPREQIVGKMRWTQFVVKEDLERMLAQHAIRRKNGEAALKHYEFRANRPDGDIRNISMNIEIIPGTKKSIASLLDITEYKKSELALRESEERFRSLFESTLDMIQIIRPDGSFLHVNPAWKKILGYSDDDIRTMSVFDIFHPDSLRHCSIKFHELLGGSAEALNIEAQFLTKDKKTISVEGNCSPKLKDGTVVSIRGIFHNVTERKRAEDALRESEEQYRTLAANLPEIVYRVYLKEHGRMQFFNDQVTALTGYRESELTQGTICSIEPLIHPDDRERVVAAVEKAITERGIFAVEYRLLHKDGSIRSFNERGRIIYGDDNEPLYIDGIIHDITEQKALHDVVSLANKKLNLLASITRHDIINQLSALNGYLELSRDLLHDPEKLEPFITKQQNIARTIEAQIRFTKDYQDLGVKAPEWQNVHDSVARAQESLSLRGITVETDRPTLEVFADPLITKVFYNLMDNAVRHGGKQIKTIRFSGAECGDDYCIICEDDGIGIPAQEKEKIFERGYRKNTGLGLFLSQEILSITGITITENGIPGKGARFEIAVPKGAYRFTGTGVK